jgi:hypothetical protein
MKPLWQKREICGYLMGFGPVSVSCDVIPGLPHKFAVVTRESG